MLRRREVSVPVLVAVIVVMFAAALVAVVLYVSATLRADQRDQWLGARSGCRVGNMRVDESNERARVQRQFLYIAYRARLAAFERDGFESDRLAASGYLALIRRVENSRRRDCIEAYPPPAGVDESDDPGATDPLSRPRRST